MDTIELIGSHPEIKGLTFVDDFIVKNNKVIVKNVRDDSIFMIYELPDLQYIKDPQGYRGFMEINSITGDIVYVNQYLRRFDIISLSGQIKSLNVYENTEGPIIKGSKLDYLNSITYYFGVMANSKSIYLYYVGKTGNEIWQLPWSFRSWQLQKASGCLSATIIWKKRVALSNCKL